MKLPRDVNGTELAGKLERFGYQITRQSGSHIRLTSEFYGTPHHITIPDHHPLKIGTLNSILNDIGIYLKMSKDDLVETLFK